MEPAPRRPGLPPAFRPGLSRTNRPARVERYPPGIDPGTHGHALLAHGALRAVVQRDPRAALVGLRQDPHSVLAAAWREARALDPRGALEAAFPPGSATVTALELGRVPAAVVALPPLACPLAVDFVAVAASRGGAAHYLISERLLLPTGELIARLGRWSPAGHFEDLGPGVPWSQLVFEDLVGTALRHQT